MWFESPLHEAACWNDVEMARALLASSDCDVNAVGREGWSALAVAVFMGRLEVARLLIDSGADATAVFGEERHTMLHAAVYKDLPEMVALLLSLAAIDVNAVDLHGRRALDYCAYYGRTSCLEALLLDPRTDISGDHSSNALSYAVCRGHKATARLLVERGGGLPVAAFYDQLVAATDTTIGSNRRAILIAAQSAGCPECFSALLLAYNKDAVDAEGPSWRGVMRGAEGVI
jgi:ankyrin repeat protein